jgi:hypothetical protein
LLGLTSIPGPAGAVIAMIRDFLIPGAKVALWGHVFTVERVYLAPTNDWTLRPKKGDLIIERRGKNGLVAINLGKPNSPWCKSVCPAAPETAER